MASWFALLLFIVPIFGQECGVSQTRAKRIVNGDEAKKGAWPWMVWIAGATSSDLSCMGVIIDKRWVATAAHCFPHQSRESRATSEFLMIAGDHETWSTDDNDPEAPQKAYKIELLLKFPEFDTTANGFGDLALLKTTEDIAFNRRVQPICLPSQGQAFGKNEPECYSAGWGEDKRTAKNSYILQQIHSKIWDRRSCADQYPGAFKDDQFCFGDGVKSTCIGDSGAPVMCKQRGKWFLAGVKSFGPHTCEGKPSVFTAIGDHAEWINRQKINY